MAFRGRGPRRRDTARQARGATSKVPQGDMQTQGRSGMLANVKRQAAATQQAKAPNVATGSPSRGGIMQRAQTAITAHRANIAPQRGTGTVARQPRVRDTAPSRGAGMVKPSGGKSVQGRIAQRSSGGGRATSGFMGRGATVGGSGATKVDGGGKVHVNAHVTGKAKAEWRAGNRIHAKRTGKTKV